MTVDYRNYICSIRFGRSLVEESDGTGWVVGRSVGRSVVGSRFSTRQAVFSVRQLIGCQTSAAPPLHNHKHNENVKTQHFIDSTFGRDLV